jgi:hypothetical protein
MNLLRDKREDERPVDAAPDGSLSEDQFQPAGENAAKQPAVKPSKSKNTLSTLLIAATIFIIAILVTYFGFYKPKEGNRTVQPNQSTALVGSSGDNAAEAASADTETTNASGQQVVVSGSQSTGESSMTTASSVMQTIQNTLGAGQVAAFFLDDGSFSAEVEAESAAGARDIYSSLESSLPVGSQLTSAEPTGSHALITGSFNASSSSDPTGLAQNDIDQALRQIAGDAGTTVASLNVDAPANEQAFVVMRLSGSFQACQTFVAKLSQKSWNISISKMILMPAPGGGFTLVLRFYM